MGTAQPQRQRAGRQELRRTGEPGLDCITAGAVTSTNLLHLSRFASTAPSWFLPVLSACLSSEPDVLYNISLSNPAEGGTLLSAPAQALFRCQLGNACGTANQSGWCPSQPPAAAAAAPLAPRTPGSVAPFLHHGTDPGWKHFPNPSTYPVWVGAQSKHPHRLQQLNSGRNMRAAVSCVSHRAQLSLWGFGVYQHPWCSSLPPYLSSQ